MSKVVRCDGCGVEVVRGNPAGWLELGRYGIDLSKIGEAPSLPMHFCGMPCVERRMHDEIEKVARMDGAK